MNSALFPHLNMGHTRAILKESETIPLVNELFIMNDNGSAITGIASFIISIEI